MEDHVNSLADLPTGLEVAQVALDDLDRALAMGEVESGAITEVVEHPDSSAAAKQCIDKM